MGTMADVALRAGVKVVQALHQRRVDGIVLAPNGRTLILDADLVEAVRDQTVDQHRRQPVVGQVVELVHHLIGHADALDALEALRMSPVDMAFVVDEHGTFEGLITAADLLEAIAGQFATHETEAEPDAVQREDGSWLLSRWKPADDMAELLKLVLPARRDYHTVAGFALAQLGRFPRLGDAFEFGSWRFEVIDIDRRRIDKVLAQPLRKPMIAP